MPTYTLFYSWQSDRKDTKELIKKTLFDAKKTFETEGITLEIDEDTRKRTGKRNIDAEVLQKIRNCDIFLADLTPITTIPADPEKHTLPRHIPNSNVMYEYGYALGQKGENHMIVLASLDKQADEHLEYMPFDINHDTITVFSDEKSLRNLANWIRNIIDNVIELERQQVVPDYDGRLLFADGNDVLEIQPTYLRTYYRAASPKPTYDHKEGIRKLLTGNTIDAIVAQMAYTQSVRPLSVKAITKTVYKSDVPLTLIFNNRGTQPLDNCHIRLTADERLGIRFFETNEKDIHSFIMPKGREATFASGNEVSQHYDTINPRSYRKLGDVFILVPHDIGEFELYWTLTSRQHQQEGTLTIRVSPNYQDEVVENDRKVGSTEITEWVEQQ